MLNRELNTDPTRSGSQVSEYIFNTFLGKTEIEIAKTRLEISPFLVDKAQDIDTSVSAQNPRTSGLLVPPCNTPASTNAPTPGKSETPSPMPQQQQQQQQPQPPPTIEEKRESSASEMLCDSLLAGWDESREPAVPQPAAEVVVNGSTESDDEEGADSPPSNGPVILPYSRLATKINELHKVRLIMCI